MIKAVVPIFLCLSFLAMLTNGSAQKNLLLFTKTEGFRHISIPEAVKMFKNIGLKKDWKIQHTEDATFFNTEKLEKVDLIIFLNTSGNILDKHQQEAFQKYVTSGKAFLGIHAASDTEYQWPWYHELIGAYFLDHPAEQEAIVKVSQQENELTGHLGKSWILFEEWYNFRDIKPHIEVFLSVDDSSYSGGKHPDFHPVAWKHNYHGGPVIYIGIGHREETFSNKTYVQLIERSIQQLLEDSGKN